MLDRREDRRWWSVTVRQRNRAASTFVHAADEILASVKAVWYLGWSTVDAPITFTATLVDE